MPAKPPPTPRQPVLGLVGGMGSGKSLVANMLAGKGGHLLPADAFGHEALRQPDIKEQVIAYFGQKIVGEDGAIVRRELGRIVFANEEELRVLERIVFPFIGRRIREEIERARKKAGVRFIVLDAAVMLEAGWDEAVDKLIFVEAPRPVRLERLQRERGWSAADLEARERMQMPLTQKKRRADAVIANDAEPDKIARQLEDLLRKWQLTDEASPTR